MNKQLQDFARAELKTGLAELPEENHRTFKLMYARDSERWLRRQKNPGGSVPLSAQEALARAEMGALKVPKTVTVRPGSPWPIRFGA